MAGRKLQEINAGSMADIAFLLLIFFLVATTMNVDSGLQRVLPPMPDPDQQQEAINVQKRNILLVFVSKFDMIMVGGEKMDITQLKDKVKNFIQNPQNLATLPEMQPTKIDLIGNFPVSKGIVSLQNDRGTSYNTYLMVQNELTRAFNEIRDEASIKYFNKKFEDLERKERKAIQTAVPLKISEAEPRNID
ncbi:MAG: biopolymer transporter ExbD [Rikenellaceae bacterium]